MFDADISPIIFHYRPRNRNTYIAISAEGEVCVRTPLKSEATVRELLRRKEAWVRQKLSLSAERAKRSPVPGETVRFLGENRTLDNFPRLLEWLDKRSEDSDIKKYYTRLYREEALQRLPSRVKEYAGRMGVCPSEIRFKKMRRRWGSCDTRGVVTFNTMVMQLAQEHIDYIIVHELAHLVHMNHSSRFHALVRRYLPDEQRLRRELREISPL